MSRREFIRTNRKAIDRAIRAAFDKPDFVINDTERELWILNDKDLYDWARSEGVDL